MLKYAILISMKTAENERCSRLKSTKK